MHVRVKHEPQSDPDDDYNSPDEDLDWLPPEKNGDPKPTVHHPLIPRKKSFELRTTNQALTQAELKKFENYEPPEPLDTYRVPAQTMKFKENPEKDAEKNFSCNMCNRS